MKPRTKSLVLQKVEAVIPRLPANHPRIPELEHALAKEMKGYIGEKKVDYFLEELDGKGTILQGICLRVQSKKFQIDTLLITENAIYIVEIKNYSGSITFDTFLNQFIQIDGEKETGYRHPITQAELQKIRLGQWLQEHGFQPLPIYFFIAISDPATIIKVIGDTSYISRLVAQGEHIPGKIMETERKIAGNGMDRLNHRQLGSRLLQKSEEYDYDILGKYGIKHSDMMSGVHCPKCGLLGMTRQRKWLCKKCNHISKNAHYKAFSDYFLLIKSSISNSECGHFLKLHSRHIAHRMLKESGLILKKESRRWVEQV